MSAREFSFEDLSQFFHLPINEVSARLGVCATVLKKICRKNGIQRWPHRKMKSLDRMISVLQLTEPQTPEERDQIQKEIQLLKEKKSYIMKTPVSTKSPQIPSISKKYNPLNKKTPSTNNIKISSIITNDSAVNATTSPKQLPMNSLIVDHSTTSNYPPLNSSKPCLSTTPDHPSSITKLSPSSNTLRFVDESNFKPLKQDKLSFAFLTSSTPSPSPERKQTALKLDFLCNSPSESSNSSFGDIQWEIHVPKRKN